MNTLRNRKYLQLNPCMILPAGNIKNIFPELPSVLNQNEKKVSMIYKITIGSQQCKRACDYRLALLDIVFIMKDILQPEILEFLLILLEFQRIFRPQRRKEYNF